MAAAEAQHDRFDFDAWRELYETDPEQFEVRRREVIDSAIASASAGQQARLRGLQWQIDALRRRHKHPMASTAKLFQMMWDKVYGENGLQDVLTRPRGRKGQAPAQTAKVLYLKPDKE